MGTSNENSNSTKGATSTSAHQADAESKTRVEENQATRVVFQDYYTGSVFDEEGSKSVGRLLDFAIAAQLSRCPSQFMFDGVIYDVILSVELDREDRWTPPSAHVVEGRKAENLDWDRLVKRIREAMKKNSNDRTFTLNVGMQGFAKIMGEDFTKKLAGKMKKESNMNVTC